MTEVVDGENVAIVDHKVSVIIPAYNAEEYIEEAVASALRQTYTEIEVIVVDDGSTDQTARIVERLGVTDSRLCLVSTENRGVAAARNTGLESATGTFVAMLDADDVWHPEKIAKQLEAFRRADSDVGLIYCYYREIDDAGRILSSPIDGPYEGWIFPVLILFNFAGSGSAALIRRSCIEEVGGFDPHLRARRAQGSEDTKLFLDIAERYKFGLVREFLMGYRQSPTSMSRDVLQMSRSQCLVLSQARKRHPELPAKLFRWAHSETCLWFASQCFNQGRLRLGMNLLGRGLLRDPITILWPSTLRALRHGLVMRYRGSRPLSTIGRLRRRGCSSPVANGASPARDEEVLFFSDLAPDFGLENIQMVGKPSQLTRRRLIAASMTVRALDERVVEGAELGAGGALKANGAG